MAEEKKKKTIKPEQTQSNLTGAQTKPTVLDNTVKLDIDTKQTLIDDIIQGGLNGGLDISKLEEFTAISNTREQIYTLIDTMSADSDVSAIIKIFAEEATVVEDNGHVIWAESDDSKVSMYVNYLLNVMNADKQMYKWAYNLVKYGDVYLRLYRESEYQDSLFDTNTINKVYKSRNVLNEDLNKVVNEAFSDDKKLDEAIRMNIHSPSDPYSLYIEMVDDPSTMFELCRLGKTFGYIEVPDDDSQNNYLNNYLVNTNGNMNSLVGNYRMKSNDVNIYQADDFVHACLEDANSRYPEKVELLKVDEDGKTSTTSSSYTVRRGKSMLYDSYKIWREKTLLEDVILLNRVTKSSILRLVQIEVGNMGKVQSRNVVKQVKSLFEQKAAINTDKSYAEYANMGPVENNVYITTHGGQGAVTVSSVGGDVDVKGLADLDNWINKYYSSFGIPKAFFGYTDDGAGFNGGTSLAIISSVFATAVKHIQNALIQALSDAINLILINRGLMSYLNNFTLKMRAPISQEELDFRANLNDRINAISNFQGLFSNVETRSRQLEIIKQLVAKLNYGDEILDILDKEIATAQALEEKAKKEAEAEAALANASEGEAGSNEDIDLDLGEEDTSDLEEIDLGNSSEAPMEGFKPTEDAMPLIEDMDLDLDESDFLTENDNLPTPEELDKDKDFSRNN